MFSAIWYEIEFWLFLSWGAKQWILPWVCMAALGGFLLGRRTSGLAASKQVKRWCPKCQSNVWAIGDKPNHLVHGGLTVLTGGTWGLVWGGTYLWKRKNPYECSLCTSETQPPHAD